MLYVLCLSVGVFVYNELAERATACAVGRECHARMHSCSKDMGERHCSGAAAERTSKRPLNNIKRVVMEATAPSAHASVERVGR